MEGAGYVVAADAAFATGQVGAKVWTVGVEDRHPPGFTAVGNEVLFEVVQLFDFADL